MVARHSKNRACFFELATNQVLRIEGLKHVGVQQQSQQTSLSVANPNPGDRQEGTKIDEIGSSPDRNAERDLPRERTTCPRVSQAAAGF